MGKIRGFWQLGKPRIAGLLTFTCAVGFVLGAQTFSFLAPSVWQAIITCMALALSAMGANAMNMSYDRDIDTIMKRTATRPIPSGVLSPWTGYIYGCILIAIACGLLLIFANSLAAFWALFGAVFYVGIYTMLLKRRTVHNIVIGGAAGAFPPLVGWAAAVGTHAPELMWHPVPWLLFLFIFLWTPPHFWALAVLLKEDYSAVKIPMLPSVSGVPEAARQSLFYTLALLPNVLVLAWFLQSWVLGVGGLCLVLWWLKLVMAWRNVAHDATMARAAAKQVFLKGMWVLAGVFGLAII